MCSELFLAWRFGAARCDVWPDASCQHVAGHVHRIAPLLLALIRSPRSPHHGGEHRLDRDNRVCDATHPSIHRRGTRHGKRNSAQITLLFQKVDSRPDGREGASGLSAWLSGLGSGSVSAPSFHTPNHHMRGSGLELVDRGACKGSNLQKTLNGQGP
jgi:hypothetical protein